MNVMVIEFVLGDIQTMGKMGYAFEFLHIYIFTFNAVHYY